MGTRQHIFNQIDCFTAIDWLDLNRWFSVTWNRVRVNGNWRWPSLLQAQRRFNLKYFPIYWSAAIQKAKRPPKAMKATRPRYNRRCAILVRDALSTSVLGLEVVGCKFMILTVPIRRSSTLSSVPVHAPRSLMETGRRAALVHARAGVGGASCARSWSHTQ